jgi:hypothetical protein
MPQFPWDPPITRGRFEVANPKADVSIRLPLFSPNRAGHGEASAIGWVSGLANFRKTFNLFGRLRS